MMPASWTVERVQAVVAYLIALREAGVEVRAAVNRLTHGIPSDAYQISDTPETWQWIEARHWITFTVDRNRRWIIVTVVQSTTLE